MPINPRIVELSNGKYIVLNHLGEALSPDLSRWGKYLGISTTWKNPKYIVLYCQTSLAIAQRLLQDAQIQIEIEEIMKGD